MKRVLIALALSALTLVGGHFYNRRWDRAVLFFVAFMLLRTLISITMATSFGMGTDPAAAEKIVMRFNLTLGVGLAVLWLASMAVTWWDAKHPREKALHTWSVGGSIAAVALSVVAAVSFAMNIASLQGPIIRFGEPDTAKVSRSESRTLAGRNFHEYLYYGGYHDAPGKLSAPPKGEGYLRGRFVYDGKPADGVRVQLTLNGKYESDYVTTDADGIFTLMLPPGEWYLNRAITDGWASMPEGEFLVVTGREPKIAEGSYHRLGVIEGEKGLRVVVTKELAPPQLSFEIRKNMVLNWPGARDEVSPTTAQAGVISWAPYPGATDYLVEITHAKREGRSTIFHPITARRLAGQTQFALAGLKTVPNTGEAKEYRVRLHAFDKDGNFLSETPWHYRSGSFTLTDGKEFVTERDLSAIGGKVTREKLNELHKNTERLSAVETLLKEGLVGEADTLFKTIRGEADPGKKKAVAGFLMASRGRCKEATNLFSEARIEAGTNCVPNYYYAKCSKQVQK